ncbi:MAG: hypothetical protein P4L53_17525 [Candidatus Obscuribacterales bacterium]|nr:hypothetical protein [Candidatus Obscuribacterales bacterium]
MQSANKTSTKQISGYLYKQIGRDEGKGRDADGRLIQGTKDHRVLFDEAPPDGLPRSGKGDVVRHIIIDPTNDNYHGGLVYGSRSMGAGFSRGGAGILCMRKSPSQ